MADAYQSATALDAWVPEEWETEILSVHEPFRAMANLVKNRPHAKHMGDLIRVPRGGSLTAVAKTAATALEFQNDTGTVTLININRHYAVPMLIEDFGEALAIAGVRQYYTKEMGKALAQEIDVYLHSLAAGWGGGSVVAGSSYSKAYDGATGAVAWDGSASTNTGNGAAFADAGFRRSLQRLADANVVDEMSFVAPPVTINSIRATDRYMSSDFVGGEKVAKGEVGDIYGVRIVQSTNCATVLADDSSTAYRAALLFSEDATVYAPVWNIRVQTDKNLKHLGQEVVADTAYGAAVHRPENGVALIVPA